MSLEFDTTTTVVVVVVILLCMIGSWIGACCGGFVTLKGNWEKRKMLPAEETAVTVGAFGEEENQESGPGYGSPI